MNILPTEKKLAVVSALVEGCSIRSTERMFDVNRNTIMSILLKVGENCQRLLDARMRGLTPKHMEFDEIWTYVAKKQKRVKADDPSEYGDQFVFVAMDPDTKLIPSFRVGKRTPETTWEFVNDVRQRITSRFQLTTDGFRPYLRAVDDAFGADVDYAVLVKSYAAGSGEPGSYHPPTIAGIFHQAIFGNPDSYLHIVRRAPEPHDSNAAPAIHTSNQRLQQELGYPLDSGSPNILWRGGGGSDD